MVTTLCICLHGLFSICSRFPCPAAFSPANAFGGAGDFRGVFSEKNPLGEAMSIGALASSMDFE